MPDLGAERVDKVKKLEDYVINIPDFPKPGIIFRDITSILRDPEGLKLSVHELMHCLEGTEFDVVVGAESRGFLFGMPLAYNKSKGFVPVRKKGKLPRETVSAKYDLEYGTAEIEIHKEDLRPGMKVVVVEDLISTGGSSLKAVEAIRRDGCEVIGMVAAYTYGFPVAEKAFKEAKVPLVTLTNYEAVMEVALRTGYIEEEDVATLNEWRKDPAHWDAGK